MRPTAAELGPARDLYATGRAVEDIESVLKALGAMTIDLYGDSYGTYAAQAFALRHPERLRSVTLDAAYPLPGTDPAFADLAAAVRRGLRLACARRDGCPARRLGVDPVALVERFAARLRVRPITGTAPDGDGTPTRVRLNRARGRAYTESVAEEAPMVARVVPLVLLLLVAPIRRVGDVHADVVPGDVITKANAEKVKDLTSPGLYWCVQHGLPMRIIAPQKLAWPPAYREATEKYWAQVKLSKDGLRLEITAAPNIGSFVADERRVRQILFNLLANAVGFSPPGSTITIAAERRPDAVIFTVTDNGPGIAPEVQDRVFDWFESHSQGSRHRGAGLGLSIVRSFVELHGGTVTLDSVVGQGTTVECRFPLEQHAGQAAA